MGPAVFNTVVGARAPRRVRFPSASAMTDTDATYPVHRETDVVLRDGSTVHIRPARPEDQEPLEDYFIGLSDESRRLRFWGASVDVRRAVVTSAVNIDYVDHLTLLAFEGAQKPLVVGRSAVHPRARQRARRGGDEHRRPLPGARAGLPVDRPARAGGGRATASEFFFAEVLPENHKMIDVFRRTGFPVSIHAKPGVVEVEFPTIITDATAEHYEDRERIAAANAVRTFLQPSLDRGDRRLTRPGDDRRSAPEEPARSAVLRRGVSGEPHGGSRAGGAGVRLASRTSPTRSTSRSSRCPRSGVLDVARQCAEKGVKGARRDLGRLRRDRRRRPRTASTSSWRSAARRACG